MSWIPLESNPQVLNEMIYRGGVKKTWKFVDVLALDEESLNFIEGPVIALIMLVPCSKKFEKITKKRIKDIKKNGQILSSSVFYMKQFIANACGAVALIHSIANNLNHDLIDEGYIKAFLDSALELNPVERGELLADSDVFAAEHNLSASGGDTEAPAPDSPVKFHFLSFVEVEGYIYELDGRKEIPINHGPSCPETFLFDAANICRYYIEQELDSLGFTVLALVYDKDAENF